MLSNEGGYVLATAPPPPGRQRPLRVSTAGWTDMQGEQSRTQPRNGNLLSWLMDDDYLEYPTVISISI